MSQVKSGFPDSKTKLVHGLSEYWQYKDELRIEKNLVVYGNRIVVPRAMRLNILKKLHASHQGIERTRRRACQTVFWPGLSVDIKNTIYSCPECQEKVPSQRKETLMTDPLPAYAFQEIASDLFSYAGKDYMVLVDRLSGWPSVYSLNNNTTSAKIIDQLETFFATFGPPQKFRSDGGPQYTSHEFKAFMEKWNIIHEMSSPHYPQSNGLAESAVKAMKRLVTKCTTNGKLDKSLLNQGLLEFRNTPRECGRSPAQMAMGRELRTLVPSVTLPSLPVQNTRVDQSRSKAETCYNKSARDLKPLNPGTAVFIQDPKTKLWDMEGRIINAGNHRQYTVEYCNGKRVTRNRKFLRPNQARNPPKPVAKPREDPKPRRSPGCARTYKAPVLKLHRHHHHLDVSKVEGGCAGMHAPLPARTTYTVSCP